MTQMNDEEASERLGNDCHTLARLIGPMHKEALEIAVIKLRKEVVEKLEAAIDGMTLPAPSLGVWLASRSRRAFMVCEDAACGTYPFPVPVFNEVDSAPFDAKLEVSHQQPRGG